jgi:voltage-gated potassium channel Kch
MPKTSHPLNDWLKTHRFLFTLIAFMLLFILYPFTKEFIRISFVLDIFLSVVLLSAIYAVGERRRALIFAVLTGVPAFFAHWVHFFLELQVLHLIDVAFGAIFFAFAAVTIVSHLFKQKRITADLIRGAICGYFLIGLMWAFLFSLLEMLQPGSFISAETGILNLQNLIYFSFVTLTTTGYGDIVPVTDQARSLSILEAVMGQMYLAVNIATLVAIRISQSSVKDPE